MNIKLNTYTVLMEKFEVAIDYGWMRAHKHTDTPSEQHIKQEILAAIGLELSEALEEE